jgi:DNA polymerase-3 subunit delta'
MPYKGIYGHERQTEILQHAMQNGRLAHAYLFHGMEGIGKRTVAERFARNLLCAAPTEEGPCDKCPACRKIDHGNHPDFITIEADGAFIKIQAIRQIAASMAYRPLRGAGGSSSWTMRTA